MKHSHRPSVTATESMRTPAGAQLDPQEAAAEAAATASRTSEGPVHEGAPEAEPSATRPTARHPWELQGSPPSLRSFRSLRPLRWDDPIETRAWLQEVRLFFEDLAAVGREGSRRIKDRTLSRAELERQESEAEHKLRALFEAADAGLAPLLVKEGGRSE
jgi:hypothetical protein